MSNSYGLPDDEEGYGVLGALNNIGLNRNAVDQWQPSENVETLPNQGMVDFMSYMPDVMKAGYANYTGDMQANQDYHAQADAMPDTTSDPLSADAGYNDISSSFQQPMMADTGYARGGTILKARAWLQRNAPKKQSFADGGSVEDGDDGSADDDDTGAVAWAGPSGKYTGKIIPLDADPAPGGRKYTGKIIPLDADPAPGARKYTGKIIPLDAEPGQKSEPNAVFSREAAENVGLSAAPAIGSLPFIGAGAALGSALFPGLGTLAGILGGAAFGLASSYGIGKLQDKLLDQSEWGQDIKQRNEEYQQAHPYVAQAGAAVPMLATFPGLAAKAAERAFGAVAMGAIGEGQRLAEGDTGFDPGKIAIDLASGALIGRPSKGAGKLLTAGESLGDKVARGMGFQRTAIGASESMPRPPGHNTTTPQEGIGQGERQDTSDPGGSDLAKKPAAQEDATDILSSFDPTVRDAITKHLSDQEQTTPAPKPTVPEGHTALPSGDEAPPNTEGMAPQNDRPPLNPEQLNQAILDEANNVINDSKRFAQFPPEVQAHVVEQRDALQKWITDHQTPPDTAGLKPDPEVTGTVTPKSETTVEVGKQPPQTLTMEGGTPDQRLGNLKRFLSDTATGKPEEAPAKGAAGEPTPNPAAEARSSDNAPTPREVKEIAKAQKIAREISPELADSIKDGPTARRVLEQLAGGASPSHQPVKGVEGAPKAAKQETIARDRSRVIEAAQSAFEKFKPTDDRIPNAKEELQAFQQKMRDALAHATEQNAGQDPFAPMARKVRQGDTQVDKTVPPYKPRQKPAAYQWLQEVKRIAEAKRVTPNMAKKFDALDRQLRSGGAAEAQAYKRAEADTALARRGDVEEAHAAQASREPGAEEDNRIEAIDAANAERAKAQVETANKQEAETHRVQEQNPVLINNILKTATKRGGKKTLDMGERPKAGKPVGESEGSASGKENKLSPEEKAKLIEQYNKNKFADKAAEEAAAKTKRDPDAIANSFEKVVSDGKKFLKDDSGMVPLDKATARLKAFGRPIKNWLKRATTETFGVPYGDRAMIGDSLMATAKARGSQVEHAWVKQQDADWQRWWKVKQSDAMAFFHAVEAVPITNKAAFVKALDDMNIKPELHDWMYEQGKLLRNVLDDAYNIEKQYGSLAEYFDNYLPHVFSNNPEFKAWLEDYTKKMLNQHPTWFEKERTFQTMKDAIQAGFKPKFENPIDLLTYRVMASYDMREMVGLMHDFVKNGVAHAINDKANLPPEAKNWPRVKVGHQEFAIAPDVYPIYDNAYQQRGLWGNDGNLGSVFRGFMTLKATWVPITLALSQFHAVHLLGVNLSDAVATTGVKNGIWQGLTDPILATKWAEKMPFLGDMAVNFGGKKVINILNKPVEQMTPKERFVRDLITQSGTLPFRSEQYKIRLKGLIEQATRNNEYWKLLPLKAMEGINKLQAPLFDSWIPTLRANAILRAAERLLKARPDLIFDETQRGVAMRGIGKSVDNRFGEMFYDTLFWDKYAKDSSVMSFLSLGWQVGQVREFGTAISDTVRNNVPALKGTELQQLERFGANRGRYALSYISTSMLAAGLITSAMTGELPNHWLDWFFPRAGGTNPDGTERRLSTVFNTREVPMLIGHIEQTNSVAGGISEMIYNKLIIQPIVDALQNRNYFGDELMDTNAPWWKRTVEMVDGVLGEAYNPIIASGAKRSRETGGSALEAYGGGFLGFNPAPAYVSRDPLTNRLYHLYHLHGAPESKPYEEGNTGLVRGIYRTVTDEKGVAEWRRDARGRLALAERNGDHAAAAQARKDLADPKRGAMSPRTAGTLKQGEGDKFTFTKLPLSDQKSLIRDMNEKQFVRYVRSNPGVVGRVRYQLEQEWRLRK